MTVPITYSVKKVSMYWILKSTGYFNQFFFWKIIKLQSFKGLTNFYFNNTMIQMTWTSQQFVLVRQKKDTTKSSVFQSLILKIYKLWDCKLLPISFMIPFHWLSNYLLLVNDPVKINNYTTFSILQSPKTMVNWVINIIWDFLYWWLMPHWVSS